VGNRVNTNEKLDGETMHEVENKSAQQLPVIKEDEIDNMESLSTLRLENQHDLGVREEMSNYSSIDPAANLPMTPVSLSHTQPLSPKLYRSTSIPTGKSVIIFM